MATSGENSLTLDSMEKFKDLLSGSTVPFGTKLSDNGPWMVPFENYIQHVRICYKMAASGNTV